MTTLVNCLVLIALLGLVGWHLCKISDNAQAFSPDPIVKKKEEYTKRLARIQSDGSELYQNDHYKARVRHCRRAIRAGDFELADYYLRRLSNMNNGKTY
ncbi:hypothetical protein [Vibrio phage vB_VhaS-a]|nr:hypothetical protein [Vibrio phage vB_VhaS-a]